jgi:Tol biopolymer transport system component
MNAHLRIAVRVSTCAALGSATGFGQSTTCLSESPTGVGGPRGGAPGALGESMSVDGRFVVFSTRATDLVAGDSDTLSDIVVFDRNFGGLELESVRSDGVKANGSSQSPAISGDGRWVVFTSRASNLPLASPPRPEDAYVRDRVTGTITRLTADLSPQTSDSIAQPRISSDGRFVTFFRSYAPTSFYPANGPLLLHDRDADGNGVLDEVGGTTTSPVTVATNGTPLVAFDSAISDNGRYIAFTTDFPLVPEDQRTCLVSTDPNTLRSCVDVYVHDRLADRNVLISLDPSGAQFYGSCRRPSISAAGRFVAFASNGDQLWVRDRDTDGDGVFDQPGLSATTAVTDGISTSTLRGNDIEIAPDGRYLAFVTADYDVPGDEGPVVCNVSPVELCTDLFLRDLSTGTTERITRSWTGEHPDAISYQPSVCPGGRFVVFGSSASNLVPGDASATWDVFVRDRESCRPGTVNAVSGPVADVLSVNGSIGSPTERLVTVAAHSPISVSLAASPAGPTTPHYALWVWRRLPRSAFFVSVSGERIGCSVNPTPDRPQGTPPLPFACLLGGLAPQFCGSIHVHPASPANAPWTRTRAAGFAAGTFLTLQGVVEDAGSATSVHLSTTNAVVVSVQ